LFRSNKAKMLKPLVTADPVYQKIQQYFNENGAKINIKQLFDSDPKRFEKFNLTLKTPNDGDILLVNKCRVLSQN
jgi:aspartate/tyrosine/aromatic aminotransferase